MADILAPAIHYAEEGFPVTEVIGGGWEASASLLSQWPDSARTFLPGGRAPRVGEIFKSPDLARTLRLIAEQGRDAFYRGDIARQIVAFSEANGGYFSMRDFEQHTSTWLDPVSISYRGYEVSELPPNGQGIAVLQMLNILEGYDLKRLGHNSAEHIHLFVEAKKLAYADRARYYADPDFHPLPVAELISKEYAAQRRQLIDPKKAALEVPAGQVQPRADAGGTATLLGGTPKPGAGVARTTEPDLSLGDTVYLTVVDKDRNCVSLIQSVFHSFGSGVVPGDLGFAMQNRGALFALDPDHLNTLEPHKRPFHTIIPAFVTKDGKPYLSFGVMGGDMQPQGHVQVLCNILDFGMNVQQAGDAARVQHFGSSRPTGGTMTDGGQVACESGVSPAALEALRAKGHRLIRATGTFGGYQAILLDPQNPVLHAGTDPRKDGCASGY